MNFGVKVIKKDQFLLLKSQYLHWLLAIFVLKVYMYNKIFACIPLRPVYLFNYGVKSILLKLLNVRCTNLFNGFSYSGL